MAIWGDGQKLCRLLIEVVATPATICDKTLTIRQNRVAKLLCLQHPDGMNIQRGAFHGLRLLRQEEKVCLKLPNFIGEKFVFYCYFSIFAVVNIYNNNIKYRSAGKNLALGSVPSAKVL